MNSIKYDMLVRRIENIEKQLGIKYPEYEITAKDVKKVREASGAGMMESKIALQLNAGNVEDAIDYIYVKGLC